MGVSNALCGNFDTLNELKSTIEYCFHREMEVSYITAEERLKENEYDEIKYLTDFSYDTALIGVSDDNRAVYDFDKMIDWLIDTQKFEYEEAKE